MHFKLFWRSSKIWFVFLLWSHKSCHSFSNLKKFVRQSPVIVKGKVWRCNSCRIFPQFKRQTASRQLEANGQPRLIWKRGVCCVGRQLPVIVKVKVWRHKTLQFWGFLLGESTYFIGFMLPTFGIICKLGGFCGPFGPRVWKFAFFDIILLKLKYLPSMSCDIEGRRHWGQIFVMYRIHNKYLPSKSSALNVARHWGQIFQL